MPRCGLWVVVLAAGTLHAQSASSQSTAVGPSQPRPASPAVPTPGEAPQSRKVELVASPIPRSLALPQRDGLDSEAASLLGSISLCDPVACLGEEPKLVIVDGKWRIRFPDSYKKPTAETKDVAKKEPASPEASGEQGATRK